jgi:hypothetical protein
MGTLRQEYHVAETSKRRVDIAIYQELPPQAGLAEESAGKPRHVVRQGKAFSRNMNETGVRWPPPHRGDERGCGPVRIAPGSATDNRYTRGGEQD